MRTAVTRSGSSPATGRLLGHAGVYPVGHGLSQVHQLMRPAPDGNSPSGASDGPLMMGVGSWDALRDSGKAADAFSCPAATPTSHRPQLTHQRLAKTIALFDIRASDIRHWNQGSVQVPDIICLSKKLTLLFSALCLPIIGDLLEDGACKMTPLRSLFLVTLLVSAPAMAEPLETVDAGAGKIQLAEQRVICPPRGNRECRTVDVKPTRAGCRRVSTGGRGRGNAFKMVCDQG
jgi:hypothetical protein